MMEQWYHSGIEGYCKAAARLMGLPDNNSGWGNFGRDLFADGRFDDPVKANRTWTLSRFRQLGRSNRPMLFEKSWLDASGPDFELDAIHACAHSICADENSSTLATLVRGDYLTFATGFRASVLPAIEDGFKTERYHSADIARYVQGLDERLGELRPSVPQTLRNFVIPLVAGLIYGPDHAVAQAHANSVTLRRGQKADDALKDTIEADASTIRIMQLFDAGLARTGYTELFDDSQVILLGRGSDVERYWAKCDEMFASEVAGRKTIVFPIASAHKSTSNEHGMLARIGDTWFFHDFSANGSFIVSADEAVQSVHDEIVTVQPGDRICLGSEETSSNVVQDYQLCTTLLVSFSVEETTLM